MSDTVSFVTGFWRDAPIRAALMIGLLTLAGLAEGVGLLALLPLLAGVLGGDAAMPFAALPFAASPAVLVAFVLAVMVAKGVLLFAAMRLIGYETAKVATVLREDLLSALLGARWRYFTGASPGAMADALGTQADRAAIAYRDACLSLATALQVLVYLVLVLALSPVAALVGVVAGGAMAAGFSPLIGVARRSGHAKTAALSQMTTRVTAIAGGLKPFKAMGRTGALRPALDVEVGRIEAAQRRFVIAQEALTAAFEPLAVIVLAAALWVLLGVAGTPLPTVMVVAVVFYRMIAQVSVLQGRYQSMAANAPAHAALRAQTREALAQAEAARGGAPLPPPGPLTARGLGVAYGGKRVFADAELTIPHGAFALVTGPSGAGKTTLVDALIGLARPDEGEVTYAGTPLDDLDPGALRGAVGYVPQDTLLLAGSVADNVDMGRGAGAPAIRAALERAGAWAFVEDHPDGLDRAVGEGGAQLSGGQRQRIALARALLGAPRLLILDEATAALDPATEDAICRTLGAMTPQVTVIAITHTDRLRREADMVVEVGGGRVRTFAAESA